MSKYLDEDGNVYEWQGLPGMGGDYKPTGQTDTTWGSPNVERIGGQPVNARVTGEGGITLYNAKSDSDSNFVPVDLSSVDLSSLGPVVVWLLVAAAVIVGLLLAITLSPIISAIVFKTAIKDFNKHSSDTSKPENKKANWPFLYWIGWLMLVTSVLPLSALGVLIGFWLFGWLVSLHPFYELPVLESMYELAVIFPAVLIGPAILVAGLLPAWTTKNKAGIMHKQAIADFFETTDENTTPSSQSAG